MLYLENPAKRFLIRLILYLACFFLFYWAPWRVISEGPVLCPFQRIFGAPCFGCGMTRAFWQIIHGNFRTAFSLNALSFLFFPMIALLLFFDIYQGIKNCLRFSRKGA